MAAGLHSVSCADTTGAPVLPTPEQPDISSATNSPLFSLALAHHTRSFLCNRDRLSLSFTCTEERRFHESLRQKRRLLREKLFHKVRAAAVYARRPIDTAVATVFGAEERRSRGATAGDLPFEQDEQEPMIKEDISDLFVRVVEQSDEGSVSPLLVALVREMIVTVFSEEEYEREHPEEFQRSIPKSQRRLQRKKFHDFQKKVAEMRQDALQGAGDEDYLRAMGLVWDWVQEFRNTSSSLEEGPIVEPEPAPQASSGLENRQARRRRRAFDIMISWPQWRQLVPIFSQNRDQWVVPIQFESKGWQRPSIEVGILPQRGYGATYIFSHIPHVGP